MPINPSKNYTTHSTPLYFYEGDPSEHLTVNWSINYLLEKGVNKEKIVLPVWSMGLAYTLTSIEDNGLYAPATQRFSDNFYEICDSIIRDNWTVVHDTDKRVGTYAYNGNQWTSYNDVEDVRRKADYIIQNNLGGGSIVNLNYDDFQEKCGCGKNPLLRAFVQVLRNEDGVKGTNCT